MSKFTMQRSNEIFINRLTNSPILFSDITPSILSNIDCYYITGTSSDTVPIAGYKGVIPEEDVLMCAVNTIKYYTLDTITKDDQRIINASRNKMFLNAITKERINPENVASTNSAAKIIRCLITKTASDKIPINYHNQFLSMQDALMENVQNVDYYTVSFL